MKIVFSYEADADLLKILTYLAERNRPAAGTLAHEFQNKLESLRRFPFIGRDRSKLLPRVRSVAVENYVIFYRIDPDHIKIIRLFDGRRDIEAEFQR